MDGPKFKVAVWYVVFNMKTVQMKLDRMAFSGGGIGGLTFAITMGRYPDIEVEIYEATNGLDTIGAGIGIWPRVWKILTSLGLDNLASKASSPPTGKPSKNYSTFSMGDNLRTLIDSKCFCIQKERSSGWVSFP